MAFNSFGFEGKKIECDILVYGYIHEIITEKKINQIIPNDIKSLCFQYWLFTACDTWNVKCLDEKKVDLIDKDRIVTLNYHTSATGSSLNFLGNHVVKDRSTYDWNMKIVKYGYKPGFLAYCNPRIGIIKDDPTKQLTTNEVYELNIGWMKLSAFDRKDRDYAPDNDAFKEWYRNSDGKLRGGICNAEGSVVTVHLDLVNYKLGYGHNGKYSGIAFENIKPGNYRFYIRFVQNTGGTELLFE